MNVFQLGKRANKILINKSVTRFLVFEQRAIGVDRVGDSTPAQQSMR